MSKFIDSQMLDGEIISYNGCMWILPVYALGVFGLLLMFWDWQLSVSVLALGAVTYLYFKTTVYIVTNRRVAIISGLVFKDFKEMRLNKIESIDTHNAMFNIGDVWVHGTGGSIRKIRLIHNVNAFRRALADAIDAGKFLLEQK